MLLEKTNISRLTSDDRYWEKLHFDISLLMLKKSWQISFRE